MSDTTPDASATVSRNVRRLRILRGWTQDEAGKRFGDITGAPWSKAVWSSAEARTRPRNWTANELAGLTELFGVTFDELFAPPGEATCPTCGQQLPDSLPPESPQEGKRYRLTGEHLQAVAATYLAAENDALPPTVTVASRYGVGHSTAAKWIGKAREAGYLPQWSTTPGGAR
ncbi:hypothetical protein GCM10010400_76080 [Streptomyces aculeolatus]|uniref:helix-turn-helix transcriptional regulator n=1 Tax=Streptomyces aculeolatus TaxID=270689 RepID=UPI001CED0AF8|nr:helix-turn-helix transcriptional regulator [Streptomyces aculeolatus]